MHMLWQLISLKQPPHRGQENREERFATLNKPLKALLLIHLLPSAVINKAELLKSHSRSVRSSWSPQPWLWVMDRGRVVWENMPACPRNRPGTKRERRSNSHSIRFARPSDLSPFRDDPISPLSTKDYTADLPLQDSYVERRKLGHLAHQVHQWKFADRNVNE